MGSTDLMKDPFYAPILHEIERTIFAVDRTARQRGVALTDSQVRSILNKARKEAEGGSPHVPASSEREQLLAGLYHDLLQTRAGLRVEERGQRLDLPARDWILALRTIEDSIRLRAAGLGSRWYLDYVEGFLEKASGAS